MTAQQLRYVITVAETGSITEAARRLFISQPSLSSAIRELETEAGIRIFSRSRNGISITAEGMEFLGYARQVVQQAGLIEEKYIARTQPKKRFAVSTQHYSFTAGAFVELVRSQRGEAYEFILREGKTADVIREQLKADVMNREGTQEVDPWKLSLIDELADMLAEKMAMQAEIRESGRLLMKWDKQGNPYKESNPLYVHIKAKEQSISVWRDKLGLSNTVNPDRIKQDAKRGVDTEKDGLSNLLTQARDTMNEIPNMD